MSSSDQCTVALVDPIWVGHHATYFRAFIESFLEVGARVVALCPKPEDLDDMVKAHPDRLSVSKLEEPGDSKLFLGRAYDPFTTRQRWRIAGEAIDAQEDMCGWKVDFVFFALLDSYLRFMPSSATADRLLGRPWTGLYFRAQHLTEPASGILAKVKQRLKGDFVMRSEDCRLISGVDERTLPYVESYSKKPVLLMPDITNEANGDPEVPLAAAIREKAAGRKIIGIVGLEKRKGFLTLLRVAKEAADQGNPWFFVFTGVLWWETLSDEEAAWVKDYLADPPDNIYLDPEAGMVPDGEVYNGVASLFDIFFAAYLNSLYNGSSNVLTKGALLEKPCIVTEGACLEDRVKAYRIGLAVPEDDDRRCFEAIKRLLVGEHWDGMPLNPRYGDYFALHSHEKLVEHVREMISTVMAG